MVNRIITFFYVINPCYESDSRKSLDWLHTGRLAVFEDSVVYASFVIMLT